MSKNQDSKSSVEHSSPLAQENRYAVVGPCTEKPGTHLRYGRPCPFCGEGPVEYDSSLNLVCQKCGKIQSGAFT